MPLALSTRLIFKHPKQEILVHIGLVGSPVLFIPAPLCFLLVECQVFTTVTHYNITLSSPLKASAIFLIDPASKVCGWVGNFPWPNNLVIYICRCHLNPSPKRWKKYC